MFPPARTGVLTYAGLTAYAFAPEGGFSAGGSTTTSRLFKVGDMPGVEQGFDFLLAATRLHLAVMEASLVIDRRIDIGMKSQAARLAAERLLFRPVGTGNEMTARAFLRRISRPPCLNGLPTLFGAPGELLGQVGQVGRIQIGVHAPGPKAHGAHVQVFAGDLMAGVLGVERIHRPVDFLPDVPSQALIGQRRQTRDALLFEAGAQFGLPAALLTVQLMPTRQLAVKGAVALAGTRGQEVCNAHVHPDYRRLVSGGLCDLLVHGQRQPPARGLARQRHAAIDALAVEHAPMIGVQFDGEADGCPLLQGADAQPIVEGAVLGRLQRDDIGGGLNNRLLERRGLPFPPGRGGALRVGLGLILGQVVHVRLLGAVAVGTPGLRDTRCVLDHHPLPAGRERTIKPGIGVLIRLRLGAKRGHVLLAQPRVRISECVKLGQLARVGVQKPNMRDGAGQFHRRHT